MCNLTTKTTLDFLAVCMLEIKKGTVKDQQNFWERRTVSRMIPVKWRSMKPNRDQQLKECYRNNLSVKAKMGSLTEEDLKKRKEKNTAAKNSKRCWFKKRRPQYPSVLEFKTAKEVSKLIAA